MHVYHHLAAHRGTCARCNGTIRVGSEIVTARTATMMLMAHTACPTDGAKPAAVLMADVWTDTRFNPVEAKRRCAS